MLYFYLDFWLQNRVGVSWIVLKNELTALLPLPSTPRPPALTSQGHHNCRRSLAAELGNPISWGGVREAHSPGMGLWLDLRCCRMANTCLPWQSWLQELRFSKTKHTHTHLSEWKGSKFQNPHSRISPLPSQSGTAWCEVTPNYYKNWSSHYVCWFLF